MTTLSFSSILSLPMIIRDFSKIIRGFEDNDVIQLTKPRINSLLKKLDRNDDYKALLFLMDLMPSWNKSDCLLLLAFAIEKGRPFLVARRSLIQQEKIVAIAQEKLAIEKINAPIKEQKFSLLIEKIATLYSEKRSIETQLAGNEISDLDFGNNNYQEQAIFVDSKIRELKEQILAL